MLFCLVCLVRQMSPDVVVAVVFVPRKKFSFHCFSTCPIDSCLFGILDKMVFQNNYDLGIDYTFDLRNYVPRINQEGFYSLSGLIEALQTTTTLTNLCIESDEEPLQHKRLIIQPLCHCIATLRLHNQHHPLRSFTIFSRSKRNSMALGSNCMGRQTNRAANC